MRDFLVKEIWTEKAHGGYYHLMVTEVTDGMCKPVEVAIQNSGWWAQCDCSGDERFAKCPHVAIARTWNRQGRPTGTIMSMYDEVRIYSIDDEDRVGYWKNGKYYPLSTCSAVNR